MFFSKRSKNKFSVDEQELKAKKETLKILKSSLENLEKILKNKELLCACYLYKFIMDNNIEAYHKFLQLLASFSNEQSTQVFRYYHNFPKDNYVDKYHEKKLKKGIDIYE